MCGFENKRFRFHVPARASASHLRSSDRIAIGFKCEEGSKRPRGERNRSDDTPYDARRKSESEM